MIVVPRPRPLHARRRPLRAPVNESWQELARGLALAVAAHQADGVGDPIERCASCTYLVKRCDRKRRYEARDEARAAGIPTEEALRARIRGLIAEAVGLTGAGLETEAALCIARANGVVDAIGVIEAKGTP